MIIAIIILSGRENNLSAQQITWEDFVEHYHSFDDDSRYDVAFEELLEIHNNPININNTSEQELSALPFLTTSQIRDILYYQSVNGPMFSLGELMYIISLDKQTRDYMHLFCYAGETPHRITLKELWSKARNELTLRTDVPFYKREGYSEDNGESKSQNKYYHGNDLYHSLRYRLNSMEHLSIGIQAEKDPGEKGIDFLSGHIMIKDIGCIRDAIIGDYKVSFGQGLVVNTGTSFGKTISLGQTDHIGRGISRYSSTSESGYFSGCATSLRFNDFIVSTYASHRRIDGNINKDSTGITSLKTDGMHRTTLESSKKQNTSVTDIGGNILWDKEKIQIAATVAYTHYSLPLMPKYDTPSSLYRFYNAKGRDFMSYGISYAYRYNGWTFLGETASCNKGGIATINSIHWNNDKVGNFTLIQRYYSHRYVAINGNAFSENSSPKNEEGVFIGWSNKNIKNIQLESHIDIYYFPWLKYQVSQSSYGYEGMIQATYSPRKSLDFSLRYKMKSKQKDFVYYRTKQDTLKTLLFNRSHNLRLTCSYHATSRLTFKTTLYGTIIDFNPSEKEYGYAISEQAQWQDTDKKIRASLSLTYFNTDGYDARIYSYEPSLLYTFGMSSYYDHGIRIVALVSFPLFRQLSVTGKVGATRFFNKESIGSGSQLINSSHKEDLQIQLRWKF